MAITLAMCPCFREAAARHIANPLPSIKKEKMTVNQRIELANKSLKGISIGDAFGESFFGETDKMLNHIHERNIPETSWEFTDDTVMAIAVYDQLRINNDINQNQLAREFAINHEKDVNRGYGATARRILREIGAGGNWNEI